jgi:hypothetical protein
MQHTFSDPVLIVSVVFTFCLPDWDVIKGHKNFVNLIGYCEENKPFKRMMVFEYAPNGTLFEHLHSESPFVQNLLEWLHLTSILSVDTKHSFNRKCQC